MPPQKKKLQDVVRRQQSLLDEVVEALRQGGGREIIQDIDEFRKSVDIYLPETKAATDFTRSEAMGAFGLRAPTPSVSRPQGWQIEEIPDTKGFEPSHCLYVLMDNYMKNFDRASEAVCRTAIDFVLNECLTAMKSNIAPTSPGQMTGNHPKPTPPPSTPPQSAPPAGDIKVFGELPFSHKITLVNQSSSSGLIVKGRVDHGIGRSIPHYDSDRRRFQSLLLLVEAKSAENIMAAFTQLIVYLGSLRQSRLSRNRSDTSVYGVASDGYVFGFVAITHDGLLLQSRLFDITRGDLPKVLGCLKYLLEKSASMSPNLTPDKKMGYPSKGDDGGDPVIDLDDDSDDD